MKFGIVADDLTGANANCSLLKKLGLRTASFIDLEEKIDPMMDVVAVTTGSRALTEREAYDTVRKAAEKIVCEKPIFLSKRIDSTLRGNIGTELKACEDVLGKEYMPIIVPSYPNTGRLVIDGKMLVNGRLLLNTDAGKDSKTPVISNRVIEEFQRQYDDPVIHVPIEDVDLGREHLCHLIQKNRASHAMMFDAVTNTHLKEIAKAVADSKRLFFTVDPGPFTKEVAEVLLKRKEKQGKILLLIGSVTDITIRQIREMLVTIPVGVVRTDAEKLAKLECYEQEIHSKIDELEEKFEKMDMVLVTTTPFNPGEQRVDLKKIEHDTGMNIDDISLMIAHGLAKIGATVIQKEKTWAGVFTSGGDITIALSKELHAKGIEIKEEIIPLVAYGRLLGGSKDGLRIISKGGMVGDHKALMECLERFKNIGGKDE